MDTTYRSIAVAGVTWMLTCPLVANGQSRPSNLQVLSPAITADSLISVMGGFTRALGVQCRYCHVESTGGFDFSRDDKVTKQKARLMLQMVALLNDSVLPTLPRRSAPRSAVACGTCHRGLPIPRTLQDSLRIVYSASGYEAMLAEYHRLRESTYGDGTFDFGEVPLADLGAYLEEIGATSDAERAHAVNVEENPRSTFAKRQHVGRALLNAFATSEADGTAKWDELAQLYPAAVFRADVLLGVSEGLARANRSTEVVTVLVRTSTLHERNASVWEALGDAYIKQADRSKARDAYTRALAVTPQSETLRAKLNSIPQ